MHELRPDSSINLAGQKIGYFEGDQAFDLFARPCATYDRDTGLLRNPNTQAIVGYVTLKGNFVGSSWIAEELFPASLQARGEPLDDTFLKSEREPLDDGFSQSEREPLNEAGFQGKRQLLDEPSLQIEPEVSTRPSLQDEPAPSDQSALQDVLEPVHDHSLQGEREPPREPYFGDEQCLKERSLQGESEPLSATWGGVGSEALSGSRGDDRKRSFWAVDPKDSSALRGVDTFMLHLAEYLRSRGAAETASELSSQDESKPAPSLGSNRSNGSGDKGLQGEPYISSLSLADTGESFVGRSEKPSPASTNDTQNASVQDELASAQDELLSATILGPDSGNDQESLQIETGSDDDIRGEPENFFMVLPRSRQVWRSPHRTQFVHQVFWKLTPRLVKTTVTAGDTSVDHYLLRVKIGQAETFEVRKPHLNGSH